MLNLFSKNTSKFALPITNETMIQQELKRIKSRNIKKVTTNKKTNYIGKRSLTQVGNL